MGGPEKLGIIDTLSAGFGTINRRLWLIAIPLVLDLALWLGPQIQATPLVNQALDNYRQLLLQSEIRLAPQQEPDKLEQIFTELSRLAKPVGRFNLLYLLAWQMHGLIRSPEDTPSILVRTATLSVGSFDLLMLLLFTLGGLSVLGVCLYLGAIAQSLQGSRFGWEAFLSRIGLNWVRVTTYLLIIFAAVLILGLLSFILIGLAGLWSQHLAALLGTLALALALWLVIHLFFAEQAIFLSDVNAPRAMWYSIKVVRRNFWSAVGLFFLTNIILLGMAIALRLLFWHPVGVMAAIAVNAYVATGLATAAMIFYQQRAPAWQENRAREIPNGRG